MRYNMLDKEAVKVVKLAQKISKDLCHTEVHLEHIFLAGLIRKGVIMPTMQKKAHILLQAKYRNDSAGNGVLSAKTQNLLDTLQNDISTNISHGKVSVDFLIECAKDDKEVSDFSKEIHSFKPVEPYMPIREPDMRFQTPIACKVLEKYSKNLTKMALFGQLEPCFGRDSEIERILRILCRKTKNNPCLIGEPGVGKTAVIEGLALLLAQGNVPKNLKNKQLFCLDLPSVIAGSKYRGDFEERVRNILVEIEHNRDIILFIDEVHSLIGAGGAEGAIDAANILKPALARGKIQLIGATTITEYRQCIEKDMALERRFQQIMVEEPSSSESIDILFKLKPRFEAFHSVIISDDAIKTAVDYSTRYLTERFLPDKAIDLLDDTAAGKSLEENPTADFLTVTSQDIAKTISKWTGIPLMELNKTDRERLVRLKSELTKHVIGQDEAITAVSNAILRARLGLANTERPMSSFLFCGASGTGKTFLAKELARQIFGSEKLLYRFDMTEYSESASLTRLIGAPPGYVGHGEAGQLTEVVRRHPFCIILFDEIEKASPSIHGLFLQILDEGTLTDGCGNKINFKNTIVIATGNIGDYKKTSLGFNCIEEKKKYISKQLNGQLSQELLGRFDEVVQFETFSEQSLVTIANNMLFELAEKLALMNFTLKYSEDVAVVIAKKGEVDFGARPMRKALRVMVENILCFDIINDIIKENDTIYLVVKDNEILVQVEKSALLKATVAI